MGGYVVHIVVSIITSVAEGTITEVHMDLTPHARGSIPMKSFFIFFLKWEPRI
jgi:hypothetical protein